MELISTLSAWILSVNDLLGFGDACVFLWAAPIVFSLPPDKSPAALREFLKGGMAEGIRAGVHRWHAKPDEQIVAINNLVDILQKYAEEWGVPTEMLDKLVADRVQVRIDIDASRGNMGNAYSRDKRDAQIRNTVDYILGIVRYWALWNSVAGKIPYGFVHDMGFLFIGEAGGKHGRKEHSLPEAATQVSNVGMDCIHVRLVLSGSDGAVHRKRSFPKGVHLAVIVIETFDKQEIIRVLVQKLHNTFHIPDTYRGQKLIVKAAFVLHSDDTPIFGQEMATITMPLSVGDFPASLIQKQ